VAWHRSLEDLWIAARNQATAGIRHDSFP
jgi:hypothetical protein